MNRVEKRSSVWVLLFPLVCLVAGTGVGRWMSAGGQAETTVWQPVRDLHRMHISPSGYNFVESNVSYENQLIAMIHDQLLHYDPVRDRLVPGLAEAHDVSPDGLVWTFRLRHAETPDGRMLRAEDVVFSFELCQDQRFDCKQRGNLYVGGQPVRAIAEDERTVRFELPQPFHSFDWAVSGVRIVPREVFQPVSDSPESLRQAVGVEQPELKYLQGFGPYGVESLDTQTVRLIRNERFWGRGSDARPRPHLERITLELRADAVTIPLDFLHDDRFPYRLVGPREAARLEDNSDFMILDRGISGWCMFFWVNQNPQAPWGKTFPDRLKLFQSVEFRRAVARALDRDAIVQNVFGGYAEPLFGPVSPVYAWAASSDTLRAVTPTLDRKVALAELAELGVLPGPPDSEGKRWLTYLEGGERRPLEIEIRTNQDEEDRRRRTAEEIRAQLAEIGLQVKVVEERFRDMVIRLDKSYDYEAAIMFLEGAPDAATLKFFFESSGPMHFVNPYQKQPATEWERQVDELFAQFASAPEPDVRRQALLEMQKVWVAAQPAFHLVNDRKLVAVRRDYELNGLALTGRAADPIFERTVIENVRIRKLVPRGELSLAGGAVE